MAAAATAPIPTDVRRARRRRSCMPARHVHAGILTSQANPPVRNQRAESHSALQPPSGLSRGCQAANPPGCRPPPPQPAAAARAPARHAAPAYTVRQRFSCREWISTRGRWRRWGGEDVAGPRRCDAFPCTQAAVVVEPGMGGMCCAENTGWVVLW
eukprot:364443-Chlamydomonas_euryale.AAC.32